MTDRGRSPHSLAGSGIRHYLCRDVWRHRDPDRSGSCSRAGVWGGSDHPGSAHLHQYKLAALVLTHGHEDHRRRAPCSPVFQRPVYGRPDAGVCRLEARRDARRAGSTARGGRRACRWARHPGVPPRTHSVPDCVAVVIDTPRGVVTTRGASRTSIRPADGAHVDFHRWRLVWPGPALLPRQHQRDRRDPHARMEVSTGFEEIFTSPGEMSWRSFSSACPDADPVDLSAQFDPRVAFVGGACRYSEIAQRLGYCASRRGPIRDSDVRIFRRSTSCHRTGRRESRRRRSPYRHRRHRHVNSARRRRGVLAREIPETRSYRPRDETYCPPTPR